MKIRFTQALLAIVVLAIYLGLTACAEKRQSMEDIPVVEVKQFSVQRDSTLQIDRFIDHETNVVCYARGPSKQRPLSCVKL